MEELCKIENKNTTL